MTKTDMRATLIEAGRQAILAGGYNATGIKDIVDAAGVPKGSFYYYFGSKEAFAAAVLEDYANQGAAGRRALLSDRSVSPLDRIRRLFESYITAYRDLGFIGGCLLGNMSGEAADHSDRLRGVLRSSFSAWQSDLESVILEAQAAGEIDQKIEAEDLAAFLIDAWEGALLRMKAERSAEPLERFQRMALIPVMGPAVTLARREPSSKTRSKA